MYHGPHLMFLEVQHCLHSFNILMTILKRPIVRHCHKVVRLINFNNLQKSVYI
jgi:hypothetical protein